MSQKCTIIYCCIHTPRRNVPLFRQQWFRIETFLRGARNVCYFVTINHIFKLEITANYFRFGLECFDEGTKSQKAVVSIQWQNVFSFNRIILCSSEKKRKKWNFKIKIVHYTGKNEQWSRRLTLLLLIHNKLCFRFDKCPNFFDKMWYRCIKFAIRTLLQWHRTNCRFYPSHFVLTLNSHSTLSAHSNKTNKV